MYQSPDGHNFSAFTPLAGGQLDTYAYASESPMDLDASLDFTRQATGRSIFPFPVAIPSTMGVCPLYDELGRFMSSVNVNGTVLTNITGLSQDDKSVVFPNIMGGLRKVKG